MPLSPEWEGRGVQPGSGGRPMIDSVTPKASRRARSASTRRSIRGERRPPITCNTALPTVRVNPRRAPTFRGPGGRCRVGLRRPGGGQELTGLHPNTTYHYSVVAENRNGSLASPQAPQTFFTTLPSAKAMLADDRDWELVSPSEKHGATAEPISREGALIQAAATAMASRGPRAVRSAARPMAIVVPNRAGALDAHAREGWPRGHHDAARQGRRRHAGAATEYRFFSSDLSLSLVEPQVPASRWKTRRSRREPGKRRSIRETTAMENSAAGDGR